VGESVYWQKIFEQSKDPTFVFLAILWYALYAWDESLDHLYTHINWLVRFFVAQCIVRLLSYATAQETNVLLTNDSHLTTELHTIQALLLHYALLLEDFRKSVTFVKNTPSPVLDSREFPDRARKDTNKLMEKECDNLLSEIDRLGFQLKNITDLVRSFAKLNSTSVNFNIQAKATVNFVDSRRMQDLTTAAVRDSAAMKQACWRLN